MKTGAGLSENLKKLHSYVGLYENERLSIGKPNETEWLSRLGGSAHVMGFPTAFKDLRARVHPTMPQG